MLYYIIHSNHTHTQTFLFAFHYISNYRSLCYYSLSEEQLDILRDSFCKKNNVSYKHKGVTKISKSEKHLRFMTQLDLETQMSLNFTF